MLSYISPERGLAAMLESMSSNATVAKIRAIHGRMLTRDNYRDMLAKRSVPELAEYLSSTRRFEDVLKDIDPMTVHRGFLEELLEKENFETYIRLCRFQQLDRLPFFDFMIHKAEINSLLLLINSLNTGLDRSYLDDLPGYIVKYSKLDLLELSRANDFTELLRLLRGTKYHKVLVRVPLGEDGTVDYTECERRLRTQYFAEILAEAQDSISDEDRDEVLRMVKADINFLNLINAYRMKAFFGFTAEQIKAHQIKLPGVGKRLDSYYQLESPELMLDWLGEHELHGEVTQGGSIEAQMQRSKFRRLEHTIYRSFNAPVVLYAFTQLCDFEAANIVHIIEGIRYGVDPTYIENNLLIC